MKGINLFVVLFVESVCIFRGPRVSELEAELGEMKGLLAHLENERRRQEMWLKER